ncbi:hypothetical protein [Pediococcus pentosaceus]|uniref:hypothetical protein n=1 Tax=Pediococcus pentosaceus TaxID=1255 RepID=UPI0013E8E567|nr:hypothetical protein [Pediococcus pentosaceus]
MKKTLISGIFIIFLGIILLSLGLSHHGAHELIRQNGSLEIEKNTTNVLGPIKFIDELV